MAVVNVYAQNVNLGIFRDDDSEVLDDQILVYERHCGDDSYTPPDIDYINEIDPDLEVPSGDDVNIQTYLNNHVASAGVPLRIQDELVYLGEYNSGEIVVNKLGYIPLVRRIQDLQRAGEVLRAYRESIYDGHDVGDDDIPINPVTAPNADFVDIDNAVKRSQEVVLNARSKGVQQPVTVAANVAAKVDGSTLAKEAGSDGSVV